jgi:hypothetical protein
MKIGEIFRTDLEREIKEVIKVDYADAHEVIEEIQDYVVTDRIHDEFLTVLDQYRETINNPSEDVNVWVSGFFGSGKSSFAKVLGYVIADPDLGGSSPASLFTEKLPTTEARALLNAIHAQAPTLSIFVDLAAGRNVAREGESVVLPIYRELLSVLDYARDFRLANLEYTLEEDGRLGQFKKAFQSVTGHEWRARRDKALAVNEASRALHEIDPENYPQADSYASTRPDVEVSANSFTVRALELLERRRPELKRIMIILDEASQYVSRSVQRMLDLQGLAQAIQKQGGRLWLVATGQEALEDVVGALGDKRVELARVNDRFAPRLRVDLVPSDIEEVVSKRVLAKHEYGAAAVRELYDAHEHQLHANVALESPTRGAEFTREDFVRVYPLVPYQIQLFIDSVSALRKAGGAGPTIGGANRTLIRLAHQLIKSTMAERLVGALVTTNDAYELVDEMIPTSWQAEIDQVLARHPGDSSHGPVARTVSLVSGVRALPLDEHNIAVLLHPAADAESRRSAVEQAVEDLLHEETLRESESGYRMQSPEEKDWEQTRRARELRIGDFNRLLRDTHLPALLRGLAAAGPSRFRAEVFFDDQRILDGDVPLRIYEGGEDQLERARSRSRESGHQNDLFLVFRRGEKTWRLAEEAFRSQEMLRDAEGRAVEGAELDLLHEERRRYERHAHRLERALAEDMLGGTLVFRGVTEELEGADLKGTLSSISGNRVAEIYTQLERFSAPVSRQDAVNILREDDLSGLPEYLGEAGLGVLAVDQSGHHVDESGPVKEFVAAVQQQVDYGSEPTGKYLEAHFERPPYGAQVDVAMVVAAAAVRAGLVRVGQGGSWLRSRADARLEQVFTTLPKFRSAVFRTREEIDPTQRARVARLLHEELVGERPGLATEELAAFAREHLERDRQAMNGVASVLSGLGLRVPEPVTRARAILDRMQNEDDETLVESLDAGRADLKDGVRSARELQELFESGESVKVLRESTQVVVNRDGLSEAAREAAERAADALQAGAYVDRFPELRAAVETVQGERRARWQEARAELNARVEELQEHVQPILDQLPEPRAAEFERRLDGLRVDDQARAEAGPSIDGLRARIAGLPRLVTEIRAAAAGGSREEVERVDVADLFPEPVRSEDDLERPNPEM